MTRAQLANEGVDDLLHLIYARQEMYMTEMHGGTHPCFFEGDQLADFLITQAFALGCELTEAMDEFRWKPWGIKRGEFIDRDAFVGELRDALQFLLNMLFAAGVTPDELNRAHRSKIEVNFQRLRHPEGDDTAARVVEGRSIDEPTRVRDTRVVNSPDGPVFAEPCPGEALEAALPFTRLPDPQALVGQQITVKNICREHSCPVSQCHPIHHPEGYSEAAVRHATLQYQRGEQQ